jgi:hypothetical protein
MILTLARLGALLSLAAPGQQPPPPEKPPELSGPFSHANLSFFLVHGPDVLKGRSFLTLGEALAQKKIRIRETGEVGTLSVENLSGDEVFIQAGEIVKGGRQDRVLSYDLIVPAHSKPMPLDAFCVESGRWQRRGNEAAEQFSSSQNALGTKALKLAARTEADQGKVWEKVAEAQTKLASNVGKKVSSASSETSLELTLENQDVEKMSEAYLKALQPALDGSRDVVGFVFAINGTMNSAEIYGSSVLFKKLWPKLLKAAVVEAISEKGGAVRPEPSAKEADGFLSVQAEAKKPQADKAGVQLDGAKKDGRILLESKEKKTGNWIHRSVY